MNWKLNFEVLPWYFGTHSPQRLLWNWKYPLQYIQKLSKPRICIVDYILYKSLSKLNQKWNNQMEKEIAGYSFTERVETTQNLLTWVNIFPSIQVIICKLSALNNFGFLKGKFLKSQILSQQNLNRGWRTSPLQFTQVSLDKYSQR